MPTCLVLAVISWCLFNTFSLPMQHLLQQQAGISHLVNFVKEGLADLEVITEGLTET